MPCWRFWAAANGQISFQHYACGNSASYQSSGGPNNAAWLVVDGVIQNNTNYQYWSSGIYSRGIEQVPNVTSTVGNVSGSCNGCEAPPPPPPSPRYDCINGSCLNKTQYGTPGIYESISACEQNCGPGC
ncbi:MAG: hypothetical protein ACKPFA_25050, partial [Dolichospermum sp.]